MRIFGNTSVSAQRARSINEMQARELSTRESVRESMAHSTKIVRINRLSTIG